MKRTLLCLIILLPSLLQAQPKIKNKKYQGLLWEISGNGMKKNSYLFGTMHVSSKMAFHLADSFYVCIHNADMVALETNPESWQEDMSRYDLGNDRSEGFNFRMNGYMPVPDDYLSINTLKFYKYDKKVERALYTNPSTINNLLYRTYGNESSDFEEDTYLDMYIYQCGKKWGKKVAGVERYGESMKLMAEAYRDAAKDRSRKERSYDGEDGYSSSKLQEAYRSGNLDWLDSINKYNSFSAAFDEKFLYRRNEIQASSIDSILRSGQSLFVGVGAAHLPGNRGVIEILRKLGYRLRPVKMGVRDSQHKNQVEKLRVPVAFNTQEAGDGLYKVDIPGKFYQFGEEGSLDQRQYADMANGSYYMVTRIMTNAWMWGHSVERVSRVVDSLLYENIPGKIISKTPIVRNGNKGIDIVNRTRRGDIQRYNIFITPFEVVIFKMSGTGDYVNAGDEAKKFFGSIRLREYAPAAVIPAVAGWKKFTPTSGGFSVDFPHSPFTGNDGSWIFDAEDKSTNTQFRVVRTDIHNYHFTEEDSFDLSLMEESFSSSDFIDKELSRKQGTFKGYPSLDCQFRDKSGSSYFTRFLIQGPHYYSIIAHGKQETPAMRNFLNSFEITPFLYKAARQRVDTSLFYSVKSPVFPEEGKEKIDMQGAGSSNSFSSDDMDDMSGIGDGAFRSKVIANDTTGEKIFITFFKPSKYTWLKDSTLLDKENQTSIFGDTSWIVRRKTKYQGPSGMKIWETIVSDTGSSRTLWTKAFYKDGTGFLLATETDTLTAPSAFIRSFYDSFTPADTLKGVDIFAKKTALFFADFMSSDSVTHKKAVNNIFALKPDSTDLLSLKKAISFLNWNEKKYLNVKKSLIGKLDDIKTRQASDYLRELYYQAGDTLELQYTALEVLLQQKTAYAFQVFRDIVVAEPPVINMQAEPDFSNYLSILRKFKSTPIQGSRYDNGEFLDELSDSLQLTKSILPGLLPLLNLDDYKQGIMRLLGQMIDEKLAKPKDYEAYINRFLLEAKQEWKKQVIGEKQKAIRKAESSANKNVTLLDGGDDDEEAERGNENLRLYTTLLLPYWETNTAVPTLLNQLFSSSDTRLKYTTAMAFLRNGRPLPDTLLGYFAGKDEYRYELYSDLSDMDMPEKFPSAFNDHLSLAKSKLVEESLYDKPDSLLYLDKLPATVKGKEGFIFFFKYKKKKDDETWRLATVGLVPKDPKLFEFTDPNSDGNDDDEDNDARSPYSFTGLTAKKISDDVPLSIQLNKELRRMLYSKRRSAKEFYDRNRNESPDEDEVVDETAPPVPAEGN